MHKNERDYARVTLYIIYFTRTLNLSFVEIATFHFVAHRREILSTAALEKFFLHVVKGKAVPLQA